MLHENPALLFRSATFADATLTRRADIRPDSFDEANRTVEAVISTGADYPRRDARGPFVERLDLSAIYLPDLVGLPVLDGHRQGGSEHVVGTISAARRDGPGIVATIRLSEADDVRSAVTKVREGVLRGVSIGYRVTTWADGMGANGIRVRTAKAWRIHEISLVSVPADTGAVVRSENMEPEIIEAGQESPVTPEARAAQIGTIAQTAGLTREWAAEQSQTDATLDEVRRRAFDAMQRRTVPAIRVHQAGPSGDDPAVRVRAFEDALYTRVNGGAPSDAARPFMSHSLRDMARDLLTMRGISIAGMDTDALFRAAMHSTADFPGLLTGVGRRTLMAAYAAAESPLKRLARQTTHTDFRPATKLKLSEVGPLQKVSEAGEIKSTSRGESAESYGLDTYGSIFAISRRSLINDDLGAFRDWSNVAGRAAAEMEANVLVDLLLSNPIMGEDGENLFDTAHGNLAASGDSPSGTSYDLAPLAAARKAMRDMKGLDGETPINAVPKFMLVGTDLETEAERVLASIYAATAGDVNPFSGRLTLLVEPRLPATAWYLFADPAVLPVLEYAYLSSAQGPQMASRDGWDVLATEFRVYEDFGAGAVDWRGAYKNAGA